ncbi:hypothetical protein BDV98DRAFT_594852 [Pterulicium gracile]|uniref:Uncharacterized protein n=1 Tax=Pterulicium gracile TaxID=1884261 RepID=A0A5C3QEL8_9AGAR|nr:hypothetical protein BDV98DRAFT_594852 [Pterula gracilis]
MDAARICSSSQLTASSRYLDAYDYDYTHPSAQSPSFQSSSFESNSLDTLQRIKLTRSIHKLGRVLGTTPQLVESPPPTNLNSRRSPVESSSNSSLQPFVSLRHYRHTSDPSLTMSIPGSDLDDLTGSHANISRISRPHLPGYSLSSFCPSTSSLAFDSHFHTPTSARRRSLAKLAWSFGEHVPPELVSSHRRTCSGCFKPDQETSLGEVWRGDVEEEM